jgi:hypothetical protein
MDSDKIAKVASQVVECWRRTGDYKLDQLHVVCHGPDTMRYYEDFQSTVFSVGVEDDVAEVSFNELLRIYWYLAGYASNPLQAERANRMTESVNDDSDFDLFQQLTQRCRFEFQDAHQIS